MRMGERKHISEMLDISNEDAMEVIRELATSVASHHLMSEAVGEMAAKYGKKAILAGMLLAKTFETNEALYEQDDEPGTGDESVC
jgi:hypothetical protein